MSTLTTRILRRADLRSDTPLSKVIESFFIHNGMAAKTKDFYRGNFNAYVAWVKERVDKEPTLADLDGDYVSDRRLLRQDRCQELAPRRLQARG